MQDLFSVKDKVVLVTGGGQGIGHMITQGFVEAGAKTYISSRKAEVVNQVAAEMSKVGTCIAIPADLSSEAGCKALADDIASREDKLHVLVNMEKVLLLWHPRCVNLLREVRQLPKK